MLIVVAGGRSTGEEQQEEGQDHTLTSSWSSLAFNEAVEVLNVTFTAIPGEANTDTVIGLSDGAPTTYADQSCQVLFNGSGSITARNGGSYSAVNSQTYTAGVSYFVEIDVDVPNETYDVTVTPDGGAPVIIATDYAFRATADVLDFIGGVIGGTVNFAVNDIIATPSPYGVVVAPTIAVTSKTDASITVSVEDQEFATSLTPQIDDGGGFEDLAPISAVATSYTFSGLTAETEYDLRIEAENSGGSATSNTVTDTTEEEDVGGFVLKTASNTGLAGAGIAIGSLTNQGTITYSSSSNGLTISGRRFTGEVTVTGSNITFHGCMFAPSSGSNTYALRLGGSNNIVEDCDFTTATGTGGLYFGIFVTSNGGHLVQRCNIQRAENLICLQDGGDNFTCVDSFLSLPTSTRGEDGHNDAVEIYSGDTILFDGCTILCQNEGTGIDAPTSPFNIAPWGGRTVRNVTLQNCYVDGGPWACVLIDTNQSASAVFNTRIINNRFGGHNSNGDYGSGFGGGVMQIHGSVSRVNTDTAGNDQFYFPHTGANLNYWWYCTNNPFGFEDLSPDNEGDVATA